MAFHQVPKDKKPSWIRPYLKAVIPGSIINPSLGEGLIRPEEITKIIPSLCWTKDQVGVLESTRPSVNFLYELQVGGYVLLPCPPRQISILDMLRLAPSAFQSESVESKCIVDDWWKSQEFARQEKTFSSGWLAIKEEPLKKSFGKDFSEQEKLLVASERLPEVSELVFSAVVFRLIRGKILFEDRSIRATYPGSHEVIIVSNSRAGISFSGDLNIAASTWGIMPVKRFV